VLSAASSTFSEAGAVAYGWSELPSDQREQKESHPFAGWTVDEENYCRTVPALIAIVVQPGRASIELR